MTAPRTARALAALGAVMMTAYAAPAGAAGGPERLPVPGGATVTIHGRGYGHGHGLSQYGAEGAARQGLSAKQIVHFYYPHTKAGTAKGIAKVLITADSDNDTTVVAEPGISVRDLGTGATTPLPTTGAGADATKWRMSADPAGGTDVSYLTDTWHVLTTLRGDGEFQRHGGLSLVVGSATVDYRGSLQSRTPENGSANARVTVNRVSLDSYVRAVVPREMPSYWHQAALKAQAIAARTYASYEIEHSTNRLYQLCDTSLCQVYGGRSAEVASTDRAVKDTARQIRTFHGDAAFTQFSASDGGWTSDGGEPYLPARKDPYDGWSGNHVSPWTTKVKAAVIDKAWPKLGHLRSITVDQRDGHGQWGGRALVVTLGGSKRNIIVSGDSFRFTLGLRSSWFDLKV
jgi:stage II sporulation protein D